MYSVAAGAVNLLILNIFTSMYLVLQTPHAIEWIQPESLDEMPLSDWFNIVVLHQNRYAK